MENNVNSNNYNTENNDQNPSLLEFDEQKQTLQLTKLKEKLSYEFDYEVNSIKLDDNDGMDCKMFYYDKKEKKYKILNYNIFNDKLLPVPKLTATQKVKYPSSIYDQEFEEYEEEKDSNNKKANFIKRLVSKKKRRYQDEDFDLDMSYITEKVIAMGFPSTGIQKLYRNSITDILKFFNLRHNNQVKIYNLCLEKDRIYNKELFNDIKVGLFPATDHNPCPIKLILEFCIDICIFLMRNPKAVAAVHCKAGKGRTGVMICSYLIFSGLCEKSEKAFRYYARKRTKNVTGVTIASQKRYIKYFETFLQANFYKPYMFLIPKILKNHFSHLRVEDGRLNVKNILHSFQKEKGYFISPNIFKLKGVKLGPFYKSKKIKIKICNFINNDFKLNSNKLIEKEEKDNKGELAYFYEQYFDQELNIYSDIRITFKEGVNFYVWVNFWYASWEMIKKFYDEKQKNEQQDSKENSIINENNSIFKDKEEKGNNVITTHSKVGTNKSLYEIIYRLKHNNDLNELIEEINTELHQDFDKKNLVIKLNMNEFDKFHEKKDYDNLKLEIYYSLINNK